MNDAGTLAIDNLTRLFNERAGPEWWGANIIDASKHLKETNDWTLFYSYLSAPKNFNPNAKLRTLQEEQPVPMEWEYPDHMVEERYQNGTETIIHVRNTLTNDLADMRIDSDDEKNGG